MHYTLRSNIHLEKIPFGQNKQYKKSPLFSFVSSNSSHLVYFNYTSSILEPFELQKKKYTSSLCYFDKRSTFEANFLKLNQHFNANLKYDLVILKSVLSRGIL